MENMIFLPLQATYLDEILKIEQVSFPTPWSKQAFLSEINDNALAYYWVSVLNDLIIGYGGMWIILDEAHVTNVAVHPGFRGRGVGRGIMTHLIGQALVLGAFKMTLEVRPSNLAAFHLYEKMGFNIAGRRKGYYTDTKEDGIIMWKTLLDVNT